MVSQRRNRNSRLVGLELIGFVEPLFRTDNARPVRTVWATRKRVMPNRKFTHTRIQPILRQQGAPQAGRQ